MMGVDRGPGGQIAAERRGGEPSGRGGSVALRLGLWLILAAASAAQETSTRRDSNGVVLIFPSASHPYTSFVAPSGRHCGYLNVNEAASLPEKGRRIVLVDGLGLAYYFVLSSVSARSTRPSQSSNAGISMRHYAYICAADGEPHILVPDSGEWVYDITVDPPTFHGAEATSSGCVDRADWSSLEGGLRCSSYGIEATQSSEELEEVCMVIGSFDIPPSAGNPPVQYDMPAYLACPVSCRNCWRCTPPNASVTPPPGCPPGGGECILAGAAGMSSGSVIDSGSPQYPSSQDGEVLIAALQAGDYSCARGEGGGSSHGDLLVVPSGGGVFVKELSVVMRTSTPGASQVIYTLDGSEPTLMHGQVGAAGMTLTLSQSAVLRAIAVMPESYSGVVRASLSSSLPPITIRLAPPVVYVTPVGFFAPQGETCFASGGGFAESRTVQTEEGQIMRRVTSNGCPTADAPGAYAMLWALDMPQAPILSRIPTSVEGQGGVIGFATDGVPITAPPFAIDEGEYRDEVLLRDSCGGVSLTALPGGVVDQTGMYHYRTESPCVGVALAEGHSLLIAFMIDGVPLFGAMDGIDQTLDDCRGHTDENFPFYHYHASPVHPYTVGCLKGCLNGGGSRGINTPLVASATCVPQQKQYDYTSLAYSAWITSPRRSARALVLAGNFSGSSRIDVICAPTPHGVPTATYTLYPSGEAFEGLGSASSHMLAGYVEARCSMDDGQVTTSTAAVSETVSGRRIGTSNLWPRTLGYWDLSDVSSFSGAIIKPLSPVQGGCAEEYPTLSTPSTVPDLSNKMGGATLIAPKCKVGFEEWDVEPSMQPSLHSLSQQGTGVLFSPTLTPEGIQLDYGTPPPPASSGITIELFVTFDTTAFPPEGGNGGLFSAIYRAPAFLGRGVSLTWDGGGAAGGPGRVRLTLEVSTEGSEALGGGRGGVTAATTPYFVPGDGLTHIAGAYNGTHVEVYVNGTIAASEVACGTPPCGNVTWPLVDNIYIVDHVPIMIGAGGSSKASHQGRILSARLLDVALTPSTVVAAAQRDPRGAINGGAGGLKCRAGTIGPYDGEEPCFPCQPGFFAEEVGQVDCMPCDYGTYAPPPGGYTACIPCPGGVLTPNMMSDGLEDCTGPDYCSVPGVCSQDTDCILGGPNGYECVCKEGFRTLPGGGCLAVCGDSQVKGNETCDDGNVVSDDGCSDECSIEPGFECQGGLTCSCLLGEAGCCQRTYSNCLAQLSDPPPVQDDLCVESCFEAYASCLQGADHAWREQLDDATAATQYTQNTVTVTDVNGTVFEVLSSGCDQGASRLCHIAFQICDDGMAMAGEDVCLEDGSSCTQAYSACMGALGCEIPRAWYDANQRA